MIRNCFPSGPGGWGVYCDSSTLDIPALPAGQTAAPSCLLSVCVWCVCALAHNQVCAVGVCVSPGVCVLGVNVCVCDGVNGSVCARGIACLCVYS